MTFSTRYSPEELTKAVAKSENIRQVCLAVGIRGRGANYETIRRHIKQLGLDTSHFQSRQRRTLAVQRRLFDEPLRVGRTRLLVTLEEFEVAVGTSRSIAEVARKIALRPDSGSTYKHIHELIARHKLDTTHFKGQGWLAGESIRVGRAATPLSEILVKGRSAGSAWLRHRLIREGLKNAACEACLATDWRAHPIPLELDHVNGDRYDNRLENLRLLCPNCHALTDNYRGRNIGRIG